MLATAAVGHIMSEQRDSFEDKVIAIGGEQLRHSSVRGYGPTCGNAADRSLDAALTQQWRHMAWVRTNATLRLYIDGVIDRAWENQTLCTQDRPDSWMSIGMFRYGAGYVPTGAFPSFLGDLDWIHISAGARSTLLSHTIAAGHQKNKVLSCRSAGCD